MLCHTHDGTINRNNRLLMIFIRALIAGIGIALVTGPCCFIIWEVFFGNFVSSALLGVTMAV